MERTALTEPLKTGFRRIFFRQTEQGEERLSVVKVILFVVYLLANLLAYFQFATLTNPIPQLRAEATGTSVLDYQIPRTSYGELALILNFLVLVGALFFWVASASLIPQIAYTIASIVNPASLKVVGGQVYFARGASFEQLNFILGLTSPSLNYQSTIDTILSTFQIDYKIRAVSNISLNQAIMDALPNIFFLLAATILVFSVCYLQFTRQEFS